MSDTISGILKLNRGGGVLMGPAGSKLPEVFVPQRLLKQLGIGAGAKLSGRTRRNRNGLELVSIDTICGQKPDAYRRRTPYSRLVAIDPQDRFHLEQSGLLTMRAMDLIAPVGKGTRGLIVSPPKAGKTTLLEHLAKAIHKTDPKTRILVLLIDERPEEVTHFRRAVEAEVYASSSDMGPDAHVELSELMLAHMQAELECGHDVVVLVDSLTRMARAFNAVRSGRGRTMSGGVDARALETPRRFFGLARNIEDGGSITILATILVDTGSRMDQLIFEEFKGTGNSELVLDRSLAEIRLFPAIDIQSSGTRREEILYDESGYEGLVRLRRALAGQPPRSALEKLLEMLDSHSTNKALLDHIQSIR